MFRKILIANRGEIALRILRACRELDIKSVAIFSEADRESPHVQLADEAFCVGPPDVSESYLNLPNIISAALISGADAIHPGYGFLAENPEFVEICKDHNIVFIGPTRETMTLMGDKAMARKTVIAESVPVLPGTDVLEEDREAFSFARQYGFPLIIKAVAGGGGKGMRIVTNEGELRDNLSIARMESHRSFGDDRIYLEKFLPDARHIEFQILADKLGNVIHLGDRDCSVQRRNQKLIEEAPSQVISPYMRRKMGDAAVRAASAIGYHGVGTVEFLFSPDTSRYFFLEMNTRIQVEHPVTEMVTGVDLVREQIKTEMDEPLDINQRQVFIRGHAIECRINAEDPDKNFMPSLGEITRFRLPGGPGIRIDTHIFRGYKVLPYYDSLLAKVISHGKDREEALIRMKRALYEIDIQGIKTTIPFHRQMLNDIQFRQSEIHTRFVENMQESIQ
ncbi:MAG: acetyl-CoA carboxylase biotin carboxylase subunit [Candidatus Eremiobacteraeota bacterium]|nr:acetyl-CoA carboxylase biotin carboxylase subunit [Candidatus Eremiobacteraeota bacterium]